MTSWKVLIVMLVLCILIHELDARRNRTRGANRRNRNRGNRGRGRGGRAGGRRGRAGTCQEIQVPMCKGLVGYTTTKLPNRFNHTTQLQVYRVLEHLWAQIDTGCSQNLRLLACSLYLPKCVRRGRVPGLEPCRKTCKLAQRACQPRLEALGYDWPPEFQCSSLPKKKCLRHRPHNSCDVQYTLCQDLRELPMCHNVGFATGMSPNMFGQCNRTEIAVEMEQFAPLVASNCSSHLDFFLCGVYRPFCTVTQGVMSFPCRELCQQVRSSCEATYTMTSGLPWPNKFQCHRYPPASDTNYTCVMPDEGAALSLT